MAAHEDECLLGGLRGVGFCMLGIWSDKSRTTAGRAEGSGDCFVHNALQWLSWSGGAGRGRTTAIG